MEKRRNPFLAIWEILSKLHCLLHVLLSQILQSVIKWRYRTEAVTGLAGSSGASQHPNGGFKAVLACQYAPEPGRECMLAIPCPTEVDVLEEQGAAEKEFGIEWVLLSSGGTLQDFQQATTFASLHQPPDVCIITFQLSASNVCFIFQVELFR